jgi:hypothetical protein
VLYCNAGDWVESLTALVEAQDGTLSVLRFADTSAARLPSNEPVEEEALA